MKKAMTVVAGLLLTTTAQAAAPTWAQMKVATWNEVTTATHAEAGTLHIKSATVAGLECWGAEATVGVGVQPLMNVISDVAATKSWSTAGITQSELLGKVGESIDYFEFLDVPGWTMSSDRFWFLRSVAVREGEDQLFLWERLVDGGAYAERFKQVVAANPSAVEPPINVGAWWFSPRGEQTFIRYYICSDTGGSIPSFVQSAATKKTLPDTVGDLVREAKKRAK